MIIVGHHFGLPDCSHHELSLCRLCEHAESPVMPDMHGRDDGGHALQHLANAGLHCGCGCAVGAHAVQQVRRETPVRRHENGHCLIYIAG